MTTLTKPLSRHFKAHLNKRGGYSPETTDWSVTMQPAADGPILVFRAKGCRDKFCLPLSKALGLAIKCGASEVD